MKNIVVCELIMKVAIVGCRNFTNYDFFKEIIIAYQNENGFHIYDGYEVTQNFRLVFFLERNFFAM